MSVFEQAIVLKGMPKAWTNSIRSIKFIGVGIVLVLLICADEVTEEFNSA